MNSSRFARDTSGQAWSLWKERKEMLCVCCPLCRVDSMDWLRVCGYRLLLSLARRVLVNFSDTTDCYQSSQGLVTARGVLSEASTGKFWWHHWVLSKLTWTRESSWRAVQFCWFFSEQQECCQNSLSAIEAVWPLSALQMIVTRAYFASQGARSVEEYIPARRARCFVA